MPVNPTYTVRLGWHATDLDVNGHLPAEQLTTPETTTTKVLAPDGAGGVHWTTATSGSSFGSNATEVGNASTGGASSSNSRADHVHKGVHSITAAGSNNLYGDVDVAAGSGIAVTVNGQTVTVASTGASLADVRIWRPLMDGAGAVVTDSGTGEAIMALGPA
jgi:hypothetical protein